MKDILQFLIVHGYALLFAWVLAEQIGLPLPSAPLMLAAGALVGAGFMEFRFAIVLPVLAALLADSLWYEIGRRRGARVLNFLCRISLEPDSCVSRTRNFFTAYGVSSLLVAKFVPGLGTVATPLAGISKVRWSRFLLFDALGTLFWVGTFTGIGYLFSGQLERAAAFAAGFGAIFGVLLFGGPAAYVLWKYRERHRFLRKLRIARITPEELKRLLDSGAAVVVVDLRDTLDYEADLQTIPGAIHMNAEELEVQALDIPRDRDVVLFCT